VYVPPLQALLANLGTSKSAFETIDTITIPVNFFKFLMQSLLIDCDLDESEYLKKNQDLALAVRNGVIKDVKMHFVGNGYFEGRPGCSPEVDEQWYLQTYPDVANAIRSGDVASAQSHFEHAGAVELRAPAPACLEDAVQWGKAVGKD
jgi:hypothetical protein